MSRSVLAEMSSWLWSIYYCNYLFHAGSGAGYFRSLFCGDNWIINERLAEISESAKDVSVFWKAPFLQNKNWLRQRAPRITTAYWKPNYNDLYRNTPFSSLRWDNIKKSYYHSIYSRTYWRCSSFLHSQERKRRCSCSLYQYMFRCFHMGWDNSHQYLVGNQECNALDDRIIFNPLTWAPIIRNTVLHNATLTQTFMLRELNPRGETSRKRVLQVSFDRIDQQN